MCPHKWPCKRNAPAWKQSYFLKAVFLPPPHEHTRTHTPKHAQTRAHTKTHAPGPAGATVPRTPRPAPGLPPQPRPPPPNRAASKQLLTWVRQSGEYITAGRWGVRVRLGVRFGGVRECG